MSAILGLKRYPSSQNSPITTSAYAPVSVMISVGLSSVCCSTCLPWLTLLLRQITFRSLPGLARSCILCMPGERDLHDVSIALHQFEKLAIVVASPKLSNGFAIASMRRFVSVHTGRNVHDQYNFITQDLEHWAEQVFPTTSVQ